MASRILLSHHRGEQKQKRRDSVAGETQDVHSEVIESQASDRLARTVAEKLGIERNSPAQKVGPTQYARNCMGNPHEFRRHSQLAVRPPLLLFLSPDYDFGLLFLS